MGTPCGWRDSGKTYELIGFEPTDVAARPRPLYLFLGGNDEIVEYSNAAIEFARQMAQRGFVAAWAEYPGIRRPQNRSGDFEVVADHCVHKGVMGCFLLHRPAQ